MDADRPGEGLTITELAARQDHIATVVGALAETVERLSARIGEAAVPSVRGRPGRDVSGAELVERVRWLTEHYVLGAVLPDCWPRHGDDGTVEPGAGLAAHDGGDAGQDTVGAVRAAWRGGALVAFLLSDEASFVTGVAVMIDGGAVQGPAVLSR